MPSMIMFFISFYSHLLSSLPQVLLNICLCRYTIAIVTERRSSRGDLR
jgi:hypothetical protein